VSAQRQVLAKQAGGPNVSRLHTVRRTSDAPFTLASRNDDQRRRPRRSLRVSPEPGPDHVATTIRADGAFVGIRVSSEDSPFDPIRDS
jgi:hypothetical protein